MIPPIDLGLPVFWLQEAAAKKFEEAFTTIQQNELNQLYGFNDKELRKRVGNSLINIDQVVVQREAAKPHGSAEISDMEIPLRWRNVSFREFAKHRIIGYA